MARCNNARLAHLAAQIVSSGAAESSWNINGIEYRRVDRGTDPETLFQFNKTYGSTPHNFIPEGPVRAHFGRIASGETTVWGAFHKGEMVGLISAEDGGGYWMQTGAGERAVSFINEFVVNPNLRGKNIGKNLTKISIDPVLGIFGIKPAIKEQYTTFHQENIGSRTAFLRSGYEEVCTYEDAYRKRITTVARYTPPEHRATQTPADDLPVTDGAWSFKGVEYRRLERSHDPEALFQFNKKHGSTPHNYIPEGPVRTHLGKIASGETLVWGALVGSELVGFISGEYGGGYWSETGPGKDAIMFINEFVVNPEKRGKNIGKYLTKISVDARLGVFGVDPKIKEMYTTFHIDNMGSRTAFIKGGAYREVMTYDDALRERKTTVAKYP